MFDYNYAGREHETDKNGFPYWPQPVVYICNAFSLSMLNRDAQASEQYARTPKPIPDITAYMADLATYGPEFVSAVGHHDTAGAIGAALGRDVAVNRVAIKLTGRRPELIIVAQLVGADGAPTRLPEGATRLPEGARFEWWAI